MEICLFCGRNGEYSKMYKSRHWDNPDKYDWYCEKHIDEVRRFQNKQIRSFLEHFKDPALREKYLNDNQKSLYDRLSKN